MQMLFADVMIDAVDSALQDSEISFDRVGADAHAILIADVLAFAMVHLIVLLNFFLGERENCSRVRHQMRRLVNHLLDDRFQILGGHALYVHGLDAPTALEHGDNWSLIVVLALARLRLRAWPSSRTPLIASFSEARLAADVGFVNFDCASEL